MTATATSDRVRDLRNLLRQKNLKTSVAGRIRAESAPEAGLWTPDGWEPGSVIEWITSGDGSGANALWLPRLRQRHPQARWLFVDPTGDLFAAGMVRWGFDLSRVIGVRTSDLSQTLWVIEQGLRSEGVEFVWGRVDRLSSVAGRRLKLAAEAGRSTCLLARGERALSEPSVADVRLQISPERSLEWDRRRWRVTVLRSKGHGIGTTGTSQLIEYDHATDDVRLASELADSTAPCPAA